MYGVFLVIQTHTHKDLFIYEYEDDMDNASQHDITSKYSTTRHGIWLVIHLIAVITVTKMNAITLESLLTVLNAPKQITGFLIALLILSPEGVGAIKAVLLNQVQQAMNIFFWISTCYNIFNSTSSGNYFPNYRPNHYFWFGCSPYYDTKYGIITESYFIFIRPNKRTEWCFVISYLCRLSGHSFIIIMTLIIVPYLRISSVAFSVIQSYT